MAKLRIVVLAVTLALCQVSQFSNGQLRLNYYANICPNVETIVRDAVAAKFKQTLVTVPATLRLFFHDCFVQGCDASVIVVSTPNNTAEKDHPDNLSLAGDGFDTVIKAKAAVDAVPECQNKVSCADILAMATRDVIALAGGPSYAVELGRLDGLSSTAASVTGRLPEPSFDLDNLTSLFAANGLSQSDMIALSGAHTLGFSHCGRFSNRIYNFTQETPVDPTMDPNYAAELRVACPPDVDPPIAVDLDPISALTFDNQYYKNLQVGRGLLTSDQVLFTDSRSRPVVDSWAQSSEDFNAAFVAAITKLGRVGVKTASDGSAQGDIRRDCAVFN